MIGSTLSHYKITAELGRGGMGVVYQAEDTKLDRTVAIKVLPTAALATDEDRARFYREARAAASLNHPNIATIHQIDEAVSSGAPHDTPPSPFIAMEFIEGDTLEARIKQGPMKLVDAVRIASEIAAGLKAAHAKDIVHRDIKSANVMLDAEGRAKILDFGLAQTAQSTQLTRMGSTLGTVAYMSPEQARGEEVDLRTDLWALGVVLYEMVAGRNPFGGDYEQAVVYSILNETPEPLTSLRTGVPMALEWIVTKSMAKDAADRYQSATDLLVDLKNVDTSSLAMSRSMASVSGMPATAPSTAVGVSNTLNRSRRTQIAAAGILMLLLAWFVGTLSSPVEDKPFRKVSIHIDGLSDIRHLEMSPTGDLIAFTGTDIDGKTGIFLHDLKTAETRFLQGTINQEYPLFSPDGARILSSAVNLNGAWVTELPSGLPVNWSDSGVGGAWESNETILLEAGGDVFRLFGAGLLMEMAVKTDSIPGQEYFIFIGDILVEERTLLASFQFSSNENARLLTVDLETGDFKTLEETAINAWYVNDGFVVYQIGTDIGRMVVRPFDKKNLSWSGPAVPLLPETNWHHVRATPAGDLLYVPPRKSAIIRKLEWLEIDRARSSVVDLGGAFWFTPSISPDGKTVLLSKSIWEVPWDVSLIAIDLASLTQSTISDLTGISSGAWTPDGSDIFRTTSPSRHTKIVKQRFGSLNITEVIEADATDPSLSQNGEWLVFTKTNNSEDSDVEAINLDTGESVMVANSAASESTPSISSDGRWVAYNAEVAGTVELRIAPIDGSDSFTIERDVELGSAWSSDGRYLYFIRSGNLFGQRVDSGSAFRTIGTEEQLTTDGLVRDFTVDPTSDRILLLTDDRPPPDYVVIEWWQNWAAELERTIGGN